VDVRCLDKVRLNSSRVDVVDAPVRNDDDHLLTERSGRRAEDLCQGDFQSGLKVRRAPEVRHVEGGRCGRGGGGVLGQSEDDLGVRRELDDSNLDGVGPHVQLEDEGR